MALLDRMKNRRGVLAVAAGTVATAGALALSVGVAAGPASGKAGAAKCTPNGELSYGISGTGITALDPATLAFSGQLPLQTLLYNSLTEYTPKGAVVPDLATKWRHSKDLKTWWFTLRRDVKYADGR